MKQFTQTSLASVTFCKRTVVVLAILLFGGVSSVFAGTCNTDGSSCTYDYNCPDEGTCSNNSSKSCDSNSDCTSTQTVKKCANSGKLGQSCSVDSDCNVTQTAKKCNEYSSREGLSCQYNSDCPVRTNGYAIGSCFDGFMEGTKFVTVSGRHNDCANDSQCKVETTLNGVTTAKCVPYNRCLNAGTQIVQQGSCQSETKTTTYTCNIYTDGKCESAGECKTYNGTYGSQPATSTSSACLEGTFTDKSDSSSEWLWGCKGSDGRTVTCSADKLQDPIYTCSDTFYDSGGGYSDYSNNESQTWTYCPDQAGASIVVDFFTFQTEAGDTLSIYNGKTATSSKLIGTYKGTNIPPLVKSTDSTGCLTFTFEADYCYTKPGWKAEISCGGDIYTKWRCQADGTWDGGTPTSCDTVNYDPDLGYVVNETVCSDSKPANTQCVTCGYNTCTGSGNACTSDADCGGYSTCQYNPDTCQVCNDGIKQGDELCDDGSLNTDQACTAEYGSSCSYCDTSCIPHTVYGPSCNDGVCSDGETPLTCPDDCGSCGNNVCEPELGEDAVTCPEDCSCGDGVCDDSETPLTCPDDCGSCGNNVCEPELGEDAVTCPEDCSCGDGVCDDSETPLTCPDDCGSCGNNVCEPELGEDAVTCPDDCNCGDGICDDTETPYTCPDDCGCVDEDQDGVCDDVDNCPDVPNPDQTDTDNDGVGDACDDCGNGICEEEKGENAVTCPVDCKCGDGLCDETETALTCPEDCGCVDADQDGVCDDVDNCPDVPNPDQTDTDNDGVGDACDDCGNGICEEDKGENAVTCPVDCNCGDGVCDETETALTCPDDCGSCGNNMCEPELGEDSITCPDDCSCGDGVCDDSETPLTCPDDCGSCGNNICEPEKGETAVTCPDDCSCGDGLCDETETALTCPDDCGSCGNNMCEPELGEDAVTCPDDCNCGDGICDDTETPYTCPDDCGCVDEDQDGVCDDVDNCPDVPNADQKDTDNDGVGDACDDCGNGICEEDKGENAVTCDVDCFCNDGVCDETETSYTCPEDCGCVDEDQDGVCDEVDNCPDVPNPDQTDTDNDGVGDACDDCGNGICEENKGENALTCPVDCNCGDGVCDETEDAYTCPDDCTTCGDGICSGDETLATCPDDCSICGDGQKTGSEVCDDGDLNGEPGRCNNTCTSYLGGYCEELTVDPQNELFVPHRTNFTCDGVGQTFELIIKKDGSLFTRVVKDAPFTHFFTFNQVGIYTVQCFVDGSVKVVCNDQQQDAYSDAALADQMIGNIDWGSVTLVEDGSYVDPSGNAFYVGIEQNDQVTQTCTNPCVETLTIDTKCGDGKLDEDYGETCDDGNQDSGDGCSGVCEEEEGWTCPVPGEPCEEICGDGLEVGEEICDDGDQNGEAGKCNQTCDGYVPETCGNGVLDTGEYCDYRPGEVDESDGCKYDCSKLDDGEDGKTSTIVCGDGEPAYKYEDCDYGDPNDPACPNCRRPSNDGGRSVCGNGRIERGEVCDDGRNTGDETSICKSDCRSFKGFRPNFNGPVPSCAFVDPPSVQDNEYLPFWRGFEDELEDGWMIPGRNCARATVSGQIPKETMMCHFLLEHSNGKEEVIIRPCHTDELRRNNNKWFDDLQDDLIELYGTDGKIEPQRGQSYIDLSEEGVTSYGEFAVSLFKVEYEVCIERTTEEGTAFVSVDKIYDELLCKYNFPVTTQYFMQKGTSLSSSTDDIKKLDEFRLLNSIKILEILNIEPFDSVSVSTAYAELKKTAEEYAAKAEVNVDGGSDIGRLGQFRRLPGQEIYVTSQPFVLNVGDLPDEGQPSVKFNQGKPTTVIVQGAGTKVTIIGDLPANLFLIVPDGTVRFENDDCDENDRIQGLIVAKNFEAGTTSRKNTISNDSLQNTEWCMDGRLIVDGVLIGSTSSQIDSLKENRRSVLDNWFGGSNSTKRGKIYDGAAVRVNASVGMWTNLPPLADAVLKLFEITRSTQ